MGVFGNLALTSVGNLSGSTIAAGMNYLQTLLANGGRDKHCKFYYDRGAGGSLLVIAAKHVLNGTTPMLKNMAVNEFNSLLNGKKRSKDVAIDGWLGGTQKAYVEAQNYGMMQIKNTKNEDVVIYALDDWGHISADAIMLGVDTNSIIAVNQEFAKYNNSQSILGLNTPEKSDVVKNRFDTKTLVWYDTTALITINSDKNMVLTKVQGRDYSRKELVSNGDIKFSVTGQITSRLPEVYPTEEVKKFIKVMNYKGIVKTNNQILDQLGISHIVITDFSLSPRQGYKSVQPYSFSAIGLQPEKEIQIADDTVVFSAPKKAEAEKEDNKWKQLLDNQINALKSMASSAFEQGLSIGTGMLENML